MCLKKNSLKPSVKIVEEQILNSKRDASPVMTAEVANVADMDQEEMMDYIVKNADHEWAYLKTVEEVGEFLEKLTKYITKPADKKPTIKEVLQEYLDLVLRGSIFIAAKIGNDEEILNYGDEYMSKKIQIIYNYVKSQNDNT